MYEVNQDKEKVESQEIDFDKESETRLSEMEFSSYSLLIFKNSTKTNSVLPVGLCEMKSH